ncbi:MAG: thrombospondin type 3 repeat-containing protein, partial [Myxococcota bacterium]
MSAAASSEADFDVYVSCGTSAIRRVELAIVLPEGSTTGSASFGPGCTESTCAAAQGLGSTVNAALSRAYGPGLATPGTRSDAVYFSLVGAGPPDGRLCSPFQELRMATIRSNTAPADTPVPTLSTEGLAPLALTPLTDTTNRVLAPAEYAFLAIDDTPNVQLSLSPALGDTTGHKWQVDLLANVELNAIVLGLVAPAGTTTSQMRFTGCTTLSGTPATRRSCSANVALGPYASPASTFTIGPAVAGSTGLRTDALYLSLVGARNSGEALAALNVAGTPVALGVVEIDTSTAQPALSLAGVGTTSVFPSVYTGTTGALVPLTSIALAGGYNVPADFDADARSDDLDNCPYVANTD